MDYNIKPGTSVYLKGLFADFYDYGETWVYTPNARSNIKSVSPDGKQITFFNCTEPNAPSGCTPGSYQYRHYIRRPDQQVYSFLSGARQDLSYTLITYEFAGSRSHNIGGQDFQTTNFNGNQSVDLALSLKDPLRPKFTALDGTNLYDPTQYVITKSSFTGYIAQQLNFQGAASLARRYNAHSHLGPFEVRIKVRNSHSTQNQNDTLYNSTNSNGSNITLSSVLSSYTNPTYYDNYFHIGSLSYGPTSSYNAIQRAVLGNLNQFTLDQVKSVTRSASGFFDANERIYASYLQNVISFGKLRLQAAVRFDGTYTEFITNPLTTNADSQRHPLPPTVTRAPLKTSGYFNALPSVQAQYQLEKNTNLRLNYR